MSTAGAKVQLDRLREFGKIRPDRQKFASKMYVNIPITSLNVRFWG
jgi:hypothetical protein